MTFKVVAVLLLVAFVASNVSAAKQWKKLSAVEQEFYTYEDYKAEFGKSHCSEHKKIFERNLRTILNHNKDDTQTFKMGVNHFTDMSEKEFSSRLGLDRSALYNYKSEYQFEAPEEVTNYHLKNTLPASVDWRYAGIITAVKDQGSCGSCWAFASTETLESHAALSVNPPVLMDLAPQQLVACALNPDKCGGNGGCQGSIAELAFDYVAANGMTTEWNMPYTSHDGKSCNPTCTCSYQNTTAAITIKGHVKLKENDYQSVMNAVASVGPLAVNVQANVWQHYASGVFPAANCSKDNTEIDHVVQLVGYGTDDKHGDYWLVRNSWTPVWGERGYIRLARPSDNKPCNPDTNPAAGTGCSGGPKKVEVCGTCGVLYDVSYPDGVQVKGI